MSNTNIATEFYKFQNVQELYNKMSNTPHFIFVGDHLTHSNVVLQSISYDTNDCLISPYTNMIMGKQISNTNLNFVINNISYTTNTIFSMYDDLDTNLNNENFYCITNEGSFYHIWKCLDNNLRSVSTVQPTYVAGSNTSLYQTSDGYRWKYMTSVDVATAIKFSTPNWFPIIANTAVSSNTINGAYDVMLVSNQGAFYNNYLDGIFKGNDLLINGNPTLFNLSNSTVATVNGYYTGCILYIVSGTGQGQYLTITDFESNTSGNIIQTNGQFSIFPQNGSVYQIRPQVNVIPVGCTPIINCIARALVNTNNSNSIYRVEVLQKGQGYIQASASIVANSILNISNTAIVRPINAPFGGHGFNQYEELYCNSLEVSILLSNSENGTILTSNFYQEIGIIKNPLFSNVNFNLINNQGNFSVGEQIFAYIPALLGSNATLNLANNILSCNTASFNNQALPGQYLYITNQGSTLNQLGVVNNIINSTAVSLVNPGLFTCTAVSIYLANVVCNAYCTNVNSSNNIFVTNASALFGVNNGIIGYTSGAIGNINQTTRNGSIKGFNTFIELYKYNATLLTGSFIQNEQVRQGNTLGNIFSLIGSTLYASNFTQVPYTNGQIIGVTSGAVANITQTYTPELLYGSGKIMYLENISQVPRVNNQSELFQVILNF